MLSHKTMTLLAPVYFQVVQAKKIFGPEGNVCLVMKENNSFSSYSVIRGLIRLMQRTVTIINTI